MPATSAMIEKVMPMARGLARQIASAAHYRDIDDLVGQSYLALVLAGRSYDESRGPFLPYAKRYVSGKLLNHIRDHQPGTRVPKQVYQEAQRFAEEFRKTHDREPSHAEIVAAVPRYEHARQVISAVGALSLEDLAANVAFDAPSHDAGPEQRVIDFHDVVVPIREIVASLPENARAGAESLMHEDVREANSQPGRGKQRDYAKQLLRRHRVTLDLLRSA